MFERFTERARQVIVLAQDEARGLKHGYIGTEHLLLGLLREEEGIAARALEGHITVEEVRNQITRIVGEGPGTVSGQIPFTPRAKKVLDLALREALSLGHNYIGTEHILLGLVREDEGIASRILLDFGSDAEKIRNQIIRMLSAPKRRVSLSDEEIRKLSRAKWEAFDAGDYEKAASLRDKERSTLVDIHEQITAICNILGIDSKYVLQLNIRPDKAEVVLFRGKEGRCKGAKYIDLETGSLATEWAEFKVRA